MLNELQEKIRHFRIGVAKKKKDIYKVFIASVI
jgi:hypothetical protein